VLGKRVSSTRRNVMKHVGFLLGLIGSFLPLACSGSSDQTGGAQTPNATHQTLSGVGDCGFSCGSVPSNLASTPSVTCSGPSKDACAWSDSADDTVSYRPCAASECPAAPQIDCPAGTARSSQQCGSTNDGACTWTTVCTPPRSTTPCPDSNGCGAEQAVGVICKDGTNGAFACVTDGTKCSWQPTCD